MEIINYMLILVLSFLGTFTGIILCNIAVEEIKSITKYLKYLNILLIVLIILIATYDINKIYSIILTIIAFTILVLIKNNYENRWIYSSMAALLFLSTLNKESLVITILIFIYGISVVTIDATKHFKNKINGQIKSSENTSLIKKTLYKYCPYLIIGIAFYIITTYIF